MIFPYLGGSLPAWGAFMVMLGLLIRAFIVGMPARRLADTEAKRADTEASEVGINHLVSEIGRLRDEVHGYRNDMHIMQVRLNKAEGASRLRADRITNMTFIIRLLIAELRRLDPSSVILAQAEALLAQMLVKDAGDFNEDPAQAAERAVKAAEDTLLQIKRKDLE